MRSVWRSDLKSWRLDDSGKGERMEGLSDVRLSGCTSLCGQVERTYQYLFWMKLMHEEIVEGFVAGKNDKIAFFCSGTI